MKFKLNLDEALFDSADTTQESSITDIDDDFSMDEHSVENILKGPAEGADTGMASEIISLINDEWEAIQGYNDAIANLRANVNSNPFYTQAITVLEEIAAEENRHVGQLQEVLKNISPNAQDIEKGQVEAEKQLKFVDGKFQIQAWETPKNFYNDDSNVDDVDTTCTLLDIDDEM